MCPMTFRTDARCRCCDLPIDSCGTAAAKAIEAEERAVRERALQEPGVAPARRRGRCPSCGARFEVGEPIRKTSEGWTPVACCPEVE